MPTHDAGDVQVRMLGERQSTLTSLTLRVCDFSEHDPDVPLIFDLRPLAQASPEPEQSRHHEPDLQPPDGCLIY